MKTQKGNSYLIWAVVLLAVLNLSTLSTIFYQRYSASKQADADSEKNEGTSDHQTEKFSGRYFRDKLQLTAPQMQQFQRFNPGFRNEARAINIRLAELRVKMLNEMASSESDTSRLIAFSDSIGIQHSYLKKITYRYYLDLKNICNSDQQLQLKELFRETFDNDGPMGSQNRGGREGRPFRGGFKNQVQ